MRDFATLFDRLDGTTSTLAKVDAMAAHFRQVEAADAAWAVFLLSGRRFKRLLAPSRLREWTIEASGLPAWLVEDSYAAVGDLAETVALLLGHPDADSPGDDDDRPLHRWIEDRVLPLRDLDEAEQQRRVVGWWRELPSRQVFLLNKMLTGALRVGVSQKLTIRAIAEVAQLEPAVISHRLMGDWTPSADWWRDLLDPEHRDADVSRPYPFFLASPIEGDPSQLGAPDDWQTEWKWDGIRGQLVRRQGQIFLWSRGEELVTPRFPEIAEGAQSLADGTVLDGEILAWRDGRPLPFARLQTRIGRKKPGAKTLRDAPVTFLAYDLLELAGEDWRTRPLEQRRAALEAVLAGSVFPISPLVDAASWQALGDQRDLARSRGVEGVMLKRRASPYGVGRRRGDWWKWKLDPMTVDAVLVYAQVGHGRRADLLTDYTFAVWRGENLVPIAKAYSGLTDAEIRRLDRWIRRHTRERYGPVRSVEPLQVFELGFEGIQRSTRHKSGLATRFPRILRWREDLAPRDADTLAQVEALLEDPA